MLRERNTRKGFVKDEQYVALARETGKIGLWLRALFETGFCYGWRRSELLGLRVSQLDFSEWSIRLNAFETKNDEGRTVQMTGTVYELLGALVAGKAPEDKVFTRGPQNKPIVSFRKAWAKATKAAGCEGLLFHDLRRTGVRNLVRAGVRENIAQKITGHKTRSVFDRYDISSPDDIREAVRMLDLASYLRRSPADPRQVQLPFEQQAGANLRRSSGDDPRQGQLSLESNVNAGPPRKPVESYRAAPKAKVEGS